MCVYDAVYMCVCVWGGGGGGGASAGVWLSMFLLDRYSVFRHRHAHRAIILSPDICPLPIMFIDCYILMGWLYTSAPRMVGQQVAMCYGFEAVVMNKRGFKKGNLMNCHFID